MKVNINDREIELKYSFRAFMLYENITDHAFQPTGKLTDFIILFYSVIMASNRELSLDYEDFVNWLDENPVELENFTGWLTDNINKNNNLTKKTEKRKDTDSKN